MHTAWLFLLGCRHIMLVVSSEHKPKVTWNMKMFKQTKKVLNLEILNVLC